jgi:hypothetical protein
MPVIFYDRHYRYLVVGFICGGLAMMAAAWIWDVV